MDKHPAEQKPSTPYAEECQARYERTGFADFDEYENAASAADAVQGDDDEGEEALKEVLGSLYRAPEK